MEVSIEGLDLSSLDQMQTFAFSQNIGHLQKLKLLSIQVRYWHIVILHVTDIIFVIEQSYNKTRGIGRIGKFGRIIYQPQRNRNT